MRGIFANRWWIQWWRISRDRFGMLCGRGGKRWRGFHSRACAFHWNLRAEADAGPYTRHRTFSQLGWSVRIDWSRRADGSHGCRSQVVVCRHAGTG